MSVGRWGGPVVLGPWSGGGPVVGGGDSVSCQEHRSPPRAPAENGRPEEIPRHTKTYIITPEHEKKKRKNASI